MSYTHADALNPISFNVSSCNNKHRRMIPKVSVLIYLFSKPNGPLDTKKTKYIHSIKNMCSNIHTKCIRYLFCLSVSNKILSVSALIYIPGFLNSVVFSVDNNY